LSSQTATTLVFYDGLCGLCDGFVQFLLKRDHRGRIAFATLQGELARRTLLPLGHDPTNLDSVFVVSEWREPGARVLSRSRAVLHALGQLGGVWRVVADIGRVVPRFLADPIYGFVARYRYRVFGKYDVCPLPRPELKSRFLD
jgi:predicted DCC family thiol-disulfide oxidoreductase YuxK